MRMLRIILGALAFAVSFTCSALQVVEPVEGVNLLVKISAKELTRLYVTDGKIRAVIANDGELVVEKDAELGQIYLRPVKLDKPLNIRVITNSDRTYSLLLQPVDIPQEDIQIKEPAGVRNRPDGKASDYAASIKGLITEMASEEVAPGVDMKAVNKEIALWEGTKFVHTAKFRSHGLIGDLYRLHNIGKDQIRIVEQEFYIKGVLAVAIENLILDPGQATDVYVVRGDR